MKIFSLALKRQMKDCILALFWPKRQIYEFFKECSVPDPVLRAVARWDVKGLTRAQMVDQVFAGLGKQADTGTLQFNIMLEMLSTWSHFDQYWFVTEPELDLAAAKRQIAALHAAKRDQIDVARKAADEQRTNAT